MGLSGATYRSKQQHIYTDLADYEAANLEAVQKQEVRRVFPHIYACVVINTAELLLLLLFAPKPLEASRKVHHTSCTKGESVNHTHSVTTSVRLKETHLQSTSCNKPRRARAQIR